MTNKHTKLALPVRVDGDNDLVDTEGFCVAYEGNVAPYNAVMIEVAKCVNYHHRLREALEGMVNLYESEVHDSWDGTSQIDVMLGKAGQAHALLAELDSLEDHSHE